MLTPEDERLKRMSSLKQRVLPAWQAAMLRQMEQADPALAERIAMQAMPRLAELNSKRSGLNDERHKLEKRVAELRAQTPQDEEQARSIAFSLSTFLQHLSTANVMLGELVEQEPGARDRKSTRLNSSH